MQHRPLLIVMLIVIGLALTGCVSTQDNPRTANETTTLTQSPTLTTVDETTTVPQTPSPTTVDEPEKGDQFVSLTEVNDSVVTEVNASKKARFSELATDQKRVFREAYNCSCNVEQNAFSFYNKDRIEYVKYNERWYFVRVSIV